MGTWVLATPDVLASPFSSVSSQGRVAPSRTNSARAQYSFFVSHPPHHLRAAKSHRNATSSTAGPSPLFVCRAPPGQESSVTRPCLHSSQSSLLTPASCNGRTQRSSCRRESLCTSIGIGAPRDISDGGRGARTAQATEGTTQAITGGTDENGLPSGLAAGAGTEEVERHLRAALAAMEKRAQAAEKEKLEALEAAAIAESKAQAYEQSMIATTEEAMAEVEAAKEAFKEELERSMKEKDALEAELRLVKNDSMDLAMKVERMAGIAAEDASMRVTEDAQLRLAEAKTDAAQAAAQVEERIRRAADEAAAAVIEEAKVTIEDALAAAELAKEQAKSAEAALRVRMGVMDDLARAEADVIKAQQTVANLESQVRQLLAEGHQLKMEAKAAVARAEAAESRINSNEFAIKELQEAHEKSSTERDEATKRALESVKMAAAAREEAAMVAYKAETESLRAALVSAQKAEKVKEMAMQRRFEALERSMVSAEATARAWKERAETVEGILKALKEGSGSVTVTEGLASMDHIVNGGRMEVMLGEDPALRWKLLAEGPRQERPDWLKRKSTAGAPLPPLRLEPLDTPVVAEVPLELPTPEEVWSIAQHKVVDDVFTKEATKRVEELQEVELQREMLERSVERSVARKMPKRVKTPDELEDTLESGTGTGREIVFQGFNWESHRRRWYLEMAPKAADLSACGITTVWLPPPTQSVAPQGYMPTDLYNLNSAYGTVEELQFCIEEMHKQDIKVLGDVVLNHRCAAKQGPDGIWNIFGGKLAWGPDAIVRDDPNFHGRGNPSSGDIFHAAPNIDHSQEFVRKDIKEWLRWLRTEIGYDGWRLDFVRGFWGGHVKEYIEASKPAFSIGEYWDSLAYEGGTVCYNQDAHRQRIINWINATGGESSAFDVTTKGILHSAVHNEYWRLIDPQGKPPGVMGWWPSRAVTFLENHDTGSTQGHWPFPRDKIMQGYAYILTHPGTPVVFYDHLYDWGLHDQIKELLLLRSRLDIHCRSPIRIMLASAEGYAAHVGERLVVKIGHADWNPFKQNDLVGRWERIVDHGADYQVWEKF
eukprot:TRINITY_DN329_c0_g2_i1.p1 TRINITY_DN329_c0_g2~~TRINITY_DN329_c0_g2_i1.p1  ORF type:complete len:1058 (-),score=276.27 TRINITY_DN329_c0_g2_i1:758-3931(-)